MSKRYRDGRTLTAFRLSPESRNKLDELAKYFDCPKADIVRREIDRAHERLVKRMAK